MITTMKKIRINSWVIALIFAVISFAIVFPLYQTHSIIMAHDWTFHASRVEEIYDNLKSGNLFTFISTHTFHKTGVTNYLFYPTLFFYPWAFFRLFLSPVTSFYLWYFIFIYLIFMISYFCCLKIVKNPVLSFIASISYSLTPYHIHLGFGVFGEFVASAFIPIAITGAYLTFYKDCKSWKILSIGMTLLLYSHLLSLFISAEIIVVLFVCSFYRNRDHLLNLVLSVFKSVILFVLLTLPIVILFVKEYMGSRIYSTNTDIQFAYLMSLKATLLTSLNVSNVGTIGPILFLTCVVGLAISKDRLPLISWIIGTLLLLMTTSLFPWKILDKTFVGTIQFPYRYLLYVGLFLSITLALASKKTVEDNGVYLDSLLVVLISLFSIITFRTVYYGNYAQIFDNTNSYFLKNYKNSGIVSNPDAFIVNNVNYQEIFSNGVRYGEFDYYPKSSHGKMNGSFFESVVKDNKPRSIVENVSYINGKRTKIQSISKANKIKFQLKKTDKGKINLPVLAYKGTYVLVDGKKSDFSISNRGTVAVKVDQKAKNVVVGYDPGISYYAGLLISLITWGMLLWLFFNNQS